MKNIYSLVIACLLFSLPMQAQVSIPYYQNFEHENFWRDINNIGGEVATVTLPTGTDRQDDYCVPKLDEDPNLSPSQECNLKIVYEGKGYSWDLSNRHVTNQNRKALKLTVRDNDIPRMGDNVDSRTRSEIVFRTPSNKKLYYKWNVFIPNDNEFIEQDVANSYHKLFQLKPQGRDAQTGQKYDLSANTIAALDYIYEPNAPADDLYRDLSFYVDPPSIIKDEIEGHLSRTHVDANRKRLYIKDGIKKGEWNSIIIKIRPSYRSNGYVQLWINGYPVVFTGYDDIKLQYEAILDTDTTKDASKLLGENVVLTNDINPIQVDYGVKLGHYRQYLTNTMSMYIDSFSVTEYFPALIPENETQLTAKYCEKILSIDDMKLTCKPIEGATNYRFHFTNEEGGEFTIDSPATTIDIRNDNRFKANDSYGVKVKATGIDFDLDYGNTCYVRTPATTRIIDGDCSKYIFNIDDELHFYGLPSASNYIVRITDTLGVKKWINTTSTSITIPNDPFFREMEYIFEVRENSTDYGKQCIMYLMNPSTKNSVSDDSEDKLNLSKNNIKESKIYPNPFSNDIVLPNFNDQKLAVKIFNIRGEVVFDKELDQKNRKLNLSKLSTGMYFLKMKGEQTDMKLTIIKK